MRSIDIIVIGVGIVHIVPYSNADNPKVVICTDFKSTTLSHNNDEVGLFA
jgi:hypothetical protein